MIDYSAIEYGEDIVVGVIYQKSWSWYVSDKYYWILDLAKLYGVGSSSIQDLVEATYNRFNIQTVNSVSASRFLLEMQQYLVPKKDLTELVQESYFSPEPESVFDYSPSLLVNFDQKVLISYFPEPVSFELYVPDGWLGYYGEIVDLVPENERYWIANGVNYFAPF